jgi:hypothetical protein
MRAGLLRRGRRANRGWECEGGGAPKRGLPLRRACGVLMVSSARSTVHCVQVMQVEGLTRENIASHLQKYRRLLEKKAGISGPVGAKDWPKLEAAQTQHLSQLRKQMEAAATPTAADAGAGVAAAAPAAAPVSDGPALPLPAAAAAVEAQGSAAAATPGDAPPLVPFATRPAAEATFPTQSAGTPAAAPRPANGVTPAPHWPVCGATHHASSTCMCVC